MGQKSKKKSGAGSASKLKKLDELAPIVALPATNDGDATTSAAANPTGEAMTGEIGFALVDELGGGAPTGIMADPSSFFEAPVTVKSTSTNRKVLLESQNSKTAAKSVSFAGNVQFSDGTEAGKAGYSSMKVQPAEKLISSTDKAQNSTGGGPSIANSIAENAGNPGNAANPNSGAAAGILSTNAQNHCINSKVISVTPLVESMAVPLSTSVDREPTTGIETVTTMVDSEAAIVESLNSAIDSVVTGPGVGMTGGVVQPLVNVIKDSNVTQNLENVAGTTGNATGLVDNVIEPAVMSMNSLNMTGNSGTSVGGSTHLSGDSAVDKGKTVEGGCSCSSFRSGRGEFHNIKAVICHVCT